MNHQPVVEELQRMGVENKQAESIVNDFSGFDARSLLSELLVRGLRWSVGLAVCAQDITVISSSGDMSAEQIQQSSEKWWSYWR